MTTGRTLSYPIVPSMFDSQEVQALHSTRWR